MQTDLQACGMLSWAVRVAPLVRAPGLCQGWLAAGRGSL